MEVNLPGENPFGQIPPAYRRLIVPAILILFGVMTAGTMVYQIEAEQVGVVQRFGKYVRTEEPGLHFKLPYGVEVVRRVMPNFVNKDAFGFPVGRAERRIGIDRALMGATLATRRAADVRFQRAIGFPTNSFLHESMMLTGDLNLAEVEWIVQYRYAEPYKALFKVRNLRETVRDMSEAVMRQVVGDRTVDEVITLKRNEIEDEVKAELQAVLDKFESGIQIKQVVLQNVENATSYRKVTYEPPKGTEL